MIKRRTLWSAIVLVAFLASTSVFSPTISWSQPALGAWIDPGHGDSCTPIGAPGFNGNTLPDEKDLNLLVAQRVMNRLGGLGYASELTRNSDHCLSVNVRPLIAAGLAPNDLGTTEEAVVFVSIHMDGDPNPDTIGTFVIYPAPKMPHRKSIRSYRADSTLAYYVNGPLQSNAAAAFLGCNRAKPLRRNVRGLAVLREARIPSALVECCTISNQCQFNNIIQNGDQGLIADGIATGISNYLGLGLSAGAASERRASGSPAEKVSPYSIVATSRTLAGALSEGFEGASFPPDGWSITSSGVGPPHSWYRTTDPLYVAAGTGASLVEGEYSGAIDERLISPMFRVSNTDSTLRFHWLGNPTFAGDVIGSCAVRPKAASTWATVWSLDQENTGLVFSYPIRTVSLGAWLGDSVQVSFRAVGMNGADFGIDEIATGVFPLTAEPTNDLCQRATPLPAGSFVLSGSTCYASNNRNPYTPPDGNACVPEDAGGGDVFYSLNALVADTLRVHLSDSAAAFTYLYLVNSCDSLSTTCLTGEESSGGEVDSSLSYVFAASGTYYLVVDTMTGSCGDFTLTGTWRGPVTAIGEPGSGPSGLTLSASPNPSRGRTVRFVGRIDTGSRSDGVLRIFDAAGRAVYTQRIPAANGRLEVSWSGHSVAGGSLPAGRYIARFEVAGKTAATAFVLEN
jgi:N-acetylmuramoyl-L-alanine amidase